MVGSVLGIGAVGSALYGYDLFGDIPAAGTVGREITVEEMRAPVLVVDLNHRLVDLNAAAEALFSVSVEAIGTPLETVSNGALDTDEVLDTREGTTVTVEHNTGDQPRVRIEATGGDAELTSRVVDNGPGIPDHELAPLREEAETDLEHGSGLGLWLVKWGLSRLNGRIEFDRTRSQGTVATLHLPPSGGRTE